MKEEAISIISDNAEVIVDSLIENEILKEIPVIGTSINIIKAVNSIRDNAYLNKVKRFLEHLGEFTEEQRQRLAEESRKDKKRRTRFGESLFSTIEQSDSLSKIDYLACAFESFLNSEIDDHELRHICHAIKTAFCDELKEIIETENVPPQILLKHNISSGLAIAIYKKPIWDQKDTEPEYEITSMTVKLRYAWSKYKMEN